MTGLGIGIGVGVGARGPGGIPSATLPLAFTNDGSFWPTLGGQIASPQLYVASTDTTWYSWEAYVNSNKRIEVSTYNHTTGKWSARFKVATSTLANANVHGVPSLVRDANGYFYAIHSCWNSQPVVSSTVNPDDPSVWRNLTGPGGATKFTYTHPLLIGSVIWMSSQASPEPDHTWSVQTWTPAADGSSITYGTRLTIIDQANRWIFSGQQVVIGTDIHLVWCSSDEAPADDLRQDVYYGIYKTATGAFTNFDGSTSIAAGSLPINDATAKASFRLFTSAVGDTGVTPDLGYDTNNHPHISFAVGTGANKFTSLTLKHLWHNGTSWQSPQDIGHLTDPYAQQAVVPKAAGVTEIWWAESDGVPTRGGNMKRCVIAADGTVGATTTIMVPSRETSLAYGLGTVGVASPANANARLTFYEIVGEDTSGQGANNDGTLLGFSYGDSGFISRPTVVSYVNAEAAAYVARMSVAPSVALSEIIDACYGKLKAIGTLSTIWDGIWLFCLHDAQAQLLNMIAGKSDCTIQGTCTQTANSGISGNGVDGYIETNINPSLGGTNYVLLSAAIGAYNASNIESTIPTFGINDGSANSSQMSFDGGSGTSSMRINMASSSTVTDSNAVGWKVADRADNTHTQRYSDGVAVGAVSAVVASAIANTTLRFGRLNTNFVTNRWCIGMLRKHLSATDNLAEYRALRTVLAYQGII